MAAALPADEFDECAEGEKRDEEPSGPRRLVAPALKLVDWIPSRLHVA